MEENCLFCRIIKGEIPSSKVYEDEEVLAFKDINPACISNSKKTYNITCNNGRWR